MIEGLDKILIDLRSSNPIIRNEAAIRIIDARVTDALPALLSAIVEPKNLRRNGTLVHALGHFENSSHFNVLVVVALEHGFEASMEAQSILAGADFDLTGPQLEEAEKLVQSLVGTTLPDHNQAALEGILGRFFSSD